MAEKTSLNLRSASVCLALIIVSAALLMWTADSVVRLLAISFLALFLPGYLLVALLLNAESIVWKISLLLPASIALVGGILLLVNYFGTYDYPLVIWLIAGTDSCLLIANILRRVNLSVFSGSGWKGNLKLVFERTNLWKELFFLSVAILIGSIIYAIIVPKQAQSFTQFYVLTADNKMPFVIDRQELENSGLTIGVSNHEGRDIRYILKIVARREDMEVNLWSGAWPVSNDSTAERVLRFEGMPEDAREIRLYLFIEDTASPYRTLSIQTQ